MRVRRFAAVLACAVLPVLALPIASSAETLKEKKERTDRQLEQQQDDLAESTAAAAQALRALRRIQRELPAAQTRLAKARGELAASRAAYTRTQAELAAAEARVDTAQQATEAASARLREARAAIGRLVRAAYMTGTTDVLVQLLNGGGPTDLADQGALLTATVTHQEQAMREVADARAELTSRESVLAAERDGVAARTRAAQDAYQQVRASTYAEETAAAAVAERVAEQAAALGMAERERSADLAAYRALQAESRRLAARIRAESSKGSGKVGALLWPTPGPVTSGYGYRQHPIFNERRFHSGIDIGAPSGQTIKAARGGRVVHAGPMGSYGNLVVIDHGNGFATAYAHQSTVLVRDGQQVKAGQAIGKVGSTGRSTGPHLHYETRVNGSTVDPMRYY